MIKQFRKLDQLMLSLGDKEATYDAGPAGWTATSAVQVYEFRDSWVDWPDDIRSDRDTIHGSQFATVTEIVRQDVRLGYAESFVRPTSLAGLAGLAGGVIAATKDGTYNAWRHKVTPVAATALLPSIGVIEKSAGEQWKYTGICADTFRLSRNGLYHGIEAGLVGSGTRATDATSFVAKVAESPLPWLKTKCWLETGTDISIAATPVQGAQNISSATPDDLSARLRDYEFNHGNALQLDDGYFPGSGKVRGRLDHGDGRSANIRLTAILDPATEVAERVYYDNQVHVAIEVHVDTGVVIAAGGAMKFGFILIVPRLHLRPIARGTQDGWATLSFEGDCMDDGTNPIWQLYVYNGYTAYLA